MGFANGRNKQMVAFPPITRGVFDSLNAVDIEDGYTPDCRNARFYPNYLKKRNGQTQVGGIVEASTRLTGGFQFRTAAGALADAVTTRSSTAANRFMQNNAGTWTARGGAVTIDTTADARVVSTAFNNVSVWSDNVNAPFQWDGTSSNAATLAGSPPARAKFLTVFGNRLVAWNYTENGPGTQRPDGYAYSALNNQGSWATTTNNGRVQQAGGQAITGVAEGDDRQLVFFERNTFEATLTGNNLAPIAVNPIYPGFGIRAGYAIVAYKGLTYVLAADGPYVIGADARPRYIGEPIREFWKTVDYTQAETFSGEYSASERAILWGVRTTSASGEVDRVLVYDPDRDTWGFDTAYVPDVSWRFTNSLGQETVAFASTDRVLEAGRGTQDIAASGGAAANISHYVWTRWHDIGLRMQRKIWFELEFGTLQLSGATFDVGYQLAAFPGTRATTSVALINQQNAGIWDTSVWDTDVWGGDDDDLALARVSLNGDSNLIRFQWQNNAAVQTSLTYYAVAAKATGAL